MNNREIKFRVWDNQSKRWCGKSSHDWIGNGIGNIGSYDKQPWKCMSFDGKIMSNDNMGGFVERDQSIYIIQQYTGLKDKNDKEIYEGDIVYVLDENNVFDVRFGSVKRNIVGFDTNTIYPVEISCFYFHRDGLPHFSITKNHLGKHDLKNTEVIGNIFENKELLE